MRAKFTLHTELGKLISFEVEAPKSELDWLEEVLVHGAVCQPVVRQDIPYQPELDAPWPIGPTLEDM